MLSSLSPSVQWRHCELDFSRSIDLTWQREWRVQGEELCFTPSDDVMIVVRMGEEAMEVAFDNWEFDHERDEVFFDVIWPFVTHEVLAVAKRPSDIEVLRVAQF